MDAPTGIRPQTLRHRTARRLAATRFSRTPVILWSGVVVVTLLSFTLHLLNAQTLRGDRVREEQRAAQERPETRPAGSLSTPAPAEHDAMLAAAAHASPVTAR